MYAHHWLPGGRQSQGQRAATLIEARPSLTTPLLHALLFGYRYRLTSPAAVSSSSDTQPAVTDGGVPPRNRSQQVSLGSAASAKLLQSGCSACPRLASICDRLECLAVLLQGVSDIICTACAAILIHDDTVARCKESSALSIACDALTQLLGSWPAIEHVASAVCETNHHTDLRCHLHRTRDDLEYLACRSWQPTPQPLQPKTAASKEDGDEVAAARRLQQSCSSLQTQLARLDAQPSKERSASAPVSHSLPTERSAYYASAALGGPHRTPHWRLPEWSRALRIGVPLSGPARRKNSGDGGNIGDHTEGACGQGCHTADSAFEECMLAEAMVRAMPGRQLRCNELQVHIRVRYVLPCNFPDSNPQGCMNFKN